MTVLKLSLFAELYLHVGFGNRHFFDIAALDLLEKSAKWESLLPSRYSVLRDVIKQTRRRQDRDP